MYGSNLCKYCKTKCFDFIVIINQKDEKTKKIYCLIVIYFYFNRLNISIENIGITGKFAIFKAQKNKLSVPKMVDTI
jgi:hypothetical protein